MSYRSVYVVSLVSILAAGCATTTGTTTGTATTQVPTSQTPTTSPTGQPTPGVAVTPGNSVGAPTTPGATPAGNTSPANRTPTRTSTYQHDVALLANKTWQQRMNIEMELFKSRDHVAFEQIIGLAPDEKTRSGRLMYTDKRLRDPRAAPVLLHRLLSGNEKPAIRRALAEALPMTNGDWEEAVPHMLKVEADPKVRLALVRCIRHSKSPYDLQGLRAGLADENPEVQVAALETAGYVANGKMLVGELLSATFDEKWERRAAAVRSLGNLRETRAWRTLVRSLSDRKPEVRLQALISLEKIDTQQAAALPEVRKLARDSSLRVAKRARAVIKHVEEPADPADETDGPKLNASGSEALANPN